MRFACLFFTLIFLGVFSGQAFGQEKTPLSFPLVERYKNCVPRLWGESLPGVVTRLPLEASGALSGDTAQALSLGAESLSPAGKTRRLALTLDACGGRADLRILELLRQQQIPATIFVTNLWLRNNPQLARQLAQDPLFSLACHGARHKPASVNGRSVYGIAGTADIKALVREVEENARSVEALTGKRPKWYRSGTAYYDDVALCVIRDLGFSVAGFSVNADQGASLPEEEVAKRILRAKDGAIIICHLNRPASGTYGGLAVALPALLRAGATFISLEEVHVSGN